MTRSWRLEKTSKLSSDTKMMYNGDEAKDKLSLDSKMMYNEDGRSNQSDNFEDKEWSSNLGMENGVKFGLKLRGNKKDRTKFELRYS
jgi:hypothetical protein